MAVPGETIPAQVLWGGREQMLLWLGAALGSTTGTDTPWPV